LILNNLDDAKILIAILNSGFSKSSWLNEVIAYFMDTGKLIIPFKVDIDSPAFISSKQALLYNYTSNIQ